MQKFLSRVLFKYLECGKTSNADVEVPEFDWAHIDRMSDLSSEGD